MELVSRGSSRGCPTGTATPAAPCSGEESTGTSPRFTRSIIPMSIVGAWYASVQKQRIALDELEAVREVVA